ncbi:hypothetical protein N8J89_13740 [Crossiella sp. CA-258035]|uniref:hypothetical protein n=1 Tax=Crossiella sp. CA-258035 TaxID=2981138 RepID=UPI0024BBF5E3|nr:hypothetical protein [Crossiella sp. CA-258035]WHT22079.1 hypothetical protein N8J89_13740 [Crossiella sp. CA-258035]
MTTPPSPSRKLWLLAGAGVLVATALAVIPLLRRGNPVEDVATAVAEAMTDYDELAFAAQLCPVTPSPEWPAAELAAAPGVPVEVLTVEGRTVRSAADSTRSATDPALPGAEPAQSARSSAAPAPPTGTSAQSARPAPDPAVPTAVLALGTLRFTLHIDRASFDRPCVLALRRAPAPASGPG